MRVHAEQSALTIYGAGWTAEETFVSQEEPINVGKKGAQERKAGRREKTPVDEREERRARVISAPREKLGKGTSVRLSADEAQSLKALAKHRQRSASQLVRKAVQEYLARQGDLEIPPSIGVIDGVYPATMHDDVVELSNMFVTLGFAVRSFEQSRMTQHRRRQLRAMLEV